MTAPAAITAQLVDVRNVAAHKSVRLELHVPAEQAGLVMAAFGWPTMADPVPVALARLVEAKEPVAKPEPAKERRPFSELPYSQQAAMRCQEPEFFKFIQTKFKPDAVIPFDPLRDNNAPPAVPYLRELIGIGSRRDLDHHPIAAERWQALEAEYYAWSRGMR